jgi:ribosome biogenesis GTPase
VLSDASGVEASFEDIAQLAAACRFSDCGHGNEPGCAVKASLQNGSLDPGRFENYLKLRFETAQAQRKRELGTERFQRQKGKHTGGKR